MYTPFNGTQPTTWSRCLFWASLGAVAYHLSYVGGWAVLALNDQRRRRVLGKAV